MMLTHLQAHSPNPMLDMQSSTQGRLKRSYALLMSRKTMQPGRPVCCRYSTSSKWHNTVSPIHRPGTSGLSGSTTCRTAGPAQVPKSGKAGDQSRPVLVKASIFNIASIVQGSSADVHGLVQNFSWCQHAAVLCFPDRPASCKAVILCAC